MNNYERVMFMKIKFSKDAVSLNDSALENVTGGVKGPSTETMTCPSCSGSISSASFKRARYQGETVTVYLCSACSRYFSKDQTTGAENLDTDYTSFVSE